MPELPIPFIFKIRIFMAKNGLERYFSVTENEYKQQLTFP